MNVPGVPLRLQQKESGRWLVLEKVRSRVLEAHVREESIGPFRGFSQTWLRGGHGEDEAVCKCRAGDQEGPTDTLKSPPSYEAEGVDPLQLLSREELLKPYFVQFEEEFMLRFYSLGFCVFFLELGWIFSVFAPICHENRFGFCLFCRFGLQGTRLDGGYLSRGQWISLLGAGCFDAGPLPQILGRHCHREKDRKRNVPRTVREKRAIEGQGLDLDDGGRPAFVRTKVYLSLVFCPYSIWKRLKPTSQPCLSKFEALFFCSRPTYCLNACRCMVAVSSPHTQALDRPIIWGHPLHVFVFTPPPG